MASGVRAVLVSALLFGGLIACGNQTEEVIAGATGSVQGSAGEHKWFAFPDLAAAEDLGFMVHEIDESQRAQWRGATAPVAERLINETGGRAGEIWAAVLRARQIYRDRAATASDKGG